MKIKKWILLMMTTLILGGGIMVYLQTTQKAAHSEKEIYYCPMHPTYTSDRPGDCPICNMKLVLKENKTEDDAVNVSNISAQSEIKEIYVCPMHPEIKSDKPGQCSICHMDLVKNGSETKDSKGVCFMHNCPMVHDGQPCPMLVMSESGEKVTCPVCGTHMGEENVEKENLTKDHASILLSPQKLQLVGVKTVVAKKQSLTKTIRSVGRVVVDETKIVHVHPKVEGWIEEIYAKYEGDAVKKGQPLFSFYSPDFVSAQEEYLLALRTLKNLSSEVSATTYENAKINLNSAKKRLLLWDISEDEIKKLEEKNVPQKALVLTSPIDGIVLVKHVFAGEYMERGADFYHLANLSTLWVEVDLYEYDLPWVKIGQEAEVTLSNDEQKKITGKVIYISPALKPQTRTAIARLECSNQENLLKPEMFVNAQINVDLGERLQVPIQAVMDTGMRKIVFVSKGHGLFEPREIILGGRGNDGVEIEKGILEGEEVVINGNFLIDSESRLKASIQGADTASIDSGKHKPSQETKKNKSVSSDSIMGGGIEGHHHGG